MKYTKNILVIFLVGLIPIFLVASRNYQGNSSSPVYFDDFEQYKNQSDLQKSWQAWQDGAIITVALEENSYNGGGQAMRIEMLGPNPQNKSMVGSIYHYLSSVNRNWTDATGFRFWINNVSDTPLLITVNFKERFNEYWAVSTNGFFMLESPEDNYLHKNIEYGNLPIPAKYSGYVVVPFTSFSVPDWNTARGDEELDLSGIETFAFGVTLQDELPQVFLLDNVSIISKPEYPYLEIKGTESIMVPGSGEHREPFFAYFIEPMSEELREVTAEWKLLNGGGEGASISHDGWLTISAGTEIETLQLIGTYHDDKIISSDSHNVRLIHNTTDQSALLENNQVLDPSSTQKANTEYERFSASFESWATENRTLFVLLSIGSVLLILVLLSAFQKKLK